MKVRLQDPSERVVYGELERFARQQLLRAQGHAQLLFHLKKHVERVSSRRNPILVLYRMYNVVLDTIQSVEGGGGKVSELAWLFN